MPRPLLLVLRRSALLVRDRPQVCSFTLHRKSYLLRHRVCFLKCKLAGDRFRRLAPDEDGCRDEVAVAVSTIQHRACSMGSQRGGCSHGIPTHPSCPINPVSRGGHENVSGLDSPSTFSVLIAPS
jgi:hypothetical protein